MRRIAIVLVVWLCALALIAPSALATPHAADPTRNQFSGRAATPSRAYHGTLNAAVADIQAYWTDEYPLLYGDDFVRIPKNRIIGARPGLKLPRCQGKQLRYADAEGHAKYEFGCGGEPFVLYDDAQLLPQLDRNFGGFAVPVVLAHEWGHRVQHEAGNIGERPILLELQADCFAGSWLAHVAHGDAPRISPRSGSLDSALAALLGFADPVGLTEDIAAQAHGSGFDRANAFQQGFDDGAEACVPYFQSPPPIVEIPFSSQQEAASGGNAPAEDVIPTAVKLLNDFYTQVEPSYVPKSVKDFRAFDSSGPKRQLPSCGGRLDRGTVESRTFYCFDNERFYFDEPYLQHVYDDIGDFGVVTLIANPFATYVERIQQFPGVETNAVNAVFGADCYTGGFAAAMVNGVLLVDPKTQEPEVTLSPGDLDETIRALIDYDQARGVSKDLGLTFLRLRAFRDGFLNGYATCSSYATADPSDG